MKIIRQTSPEYGFPFIACVPEQVSGQPALIVQLHGAGERGNTPEALEKVTVHGFSNIVNDDNFQNCILVMPQCPPDTFWAAKVESLKRFIDHMMAQFHADPGRIYLCGLSMGGFGTWYTAMAYPDLFAAIVPCCGGGMAWNAGVLKMPVWAFHGMEDTVVSPNHTIEMVRALEKTNPALRYTLFEGVGHDSWKPAFCEETLAWLLAQHK